MADLLFVLRPWNRQTNKAVKRRQTKHGPASNHVGDVIEIRRPGERADPTRKERTLFYFLLVRDVPERAPFHVMRNDKIEDPTAGTNRPRVMGFGGPDPEFTAARKHLLTGLPEAVQSNVLAYFNRDVEQPADEFPSVAWSDLRTRLWNKATETRPTGIDLDDDAAGRMKEIHTRLLELDRQRFGF